MNWRLILSLSAFGLIMGIASVLGWTKGIEGVLWGIIQLFCAVWIARRVAEKHFYHGLTVGLISGTVAPLIQFILFPIYVSNNPEFMESFTQAPAPVSPRYFPLVLAPLIGSASGLVLGLLAWAVGKIFKKATNTVQSNE
jgi:uncharacterized membrane protein YGL010W